MSALSLREVTDELLRQEDVLRQGGGEDGQRRQRKHGRLPVRERLDLLLDEGSRFFEFGLWAADGMYSEWGDVPAAGIVTGFGRVCGRPCLIAANDATVKAGAMFPQSVQPAIFVVIAGALFFRRGTTAGAWACLVLGIGYAAVGALGGWAALGKSLQLTDWPFFAWDHTKPPTRALVGMPLSAAVLLIVSLCTARWASDESRAAEHAVWLNRMWFTPGGWTRAARPASSWRRFV